MFYVGFLIALAIGTGLVGLFLLLSFADELAPKSIRILSVILLSITLFISYNINYHYNNISETDNFDIEKICVEHTDSCSLINYNNEIIILNEIFNVDVGDIDYVYVTPEHYIYSSNYVYDYVPLKLNLKDPDEG